MNKKSKKYTALATLVVAIGVIALVLTKATLYTPELELPAAAVVPLAGFHSGPSHYPVRVAIPKINVSARIQDRGLIAGNRMAAPTNYTDIGWYKYGTVPGDAGTAVLYAHLDNGLGLSGVFKHLDQLSLGDEIDITTASGTPQKFIVSKMETYPYNKVPGEALGQGSNDGTSYISLITCAGKPLRDPVIGYTYDHRLVVYAKLAS